MKTNTKQELAILAISGVAILGIKIIEQRHQIRRLERSNKLKNEILESMIAYLDAVESGEPDEYAEAKLMEQLKFIEIVAKEDL